MNPLSKIEQAYNQQRKEKYGIDHLEVQPVRRTVDLIEPSKPVMPSRYDTQFKQAIKDKYNIQSLQMEGQLGQRIERTLEDALIDDAKSRSVGMRLATSSVNYQSKKIRLWYEISK